MGMPKTFAVFGEGFFRVSGQSKENLSKADTSLKWTKIFGPVRVCFRELPLQLLLLLVVKAITVDYNQH